MLLARCRTGAYEPLLPLWRQFCWVAMWRWSPNCGRNIPTGHPAEQRSLTLLRSRCGRPYTVGNGAEPRAPLNNQMTRCKKCACYV